MKKKLSQYILIAIVIVLMIIAYIYVGEAESSIDTTSGSQDYTMTIPGFGWEIDFRTTGLLVASIFI